MSNESFFFIQSGLEPLLSSPVVQQLQQYSEQEKEQVYIVRTPLSEDKYNYDYTGGFLLLIPKHKITFIHLSGDKSKFDEYVEEFTEDLASISDKYRYKEHIGRPKAWRQLIETWIWNSERIQAKLRETYLPDEADQRIGELLISLITGSINDIERIKATVPQSLLDRVKQKIILFDGEQTRFIYQKIPSSKITIQGLSGTGKTELLLHKLKELYISTSDKKSKIIFTCHNRILAANMKRRIPEFFNFMKVEQQILWEERLWCVHAWGSEAEPCSGAYRYICSYYRIPFNRFGPLMPFDKACQLAIEELKQIPDLKNNPAFDFFLIDESQDFPDSFINLCEMTCREKIYIAGDIFQSIFESGKVDKVTPTFLLNKCYRTDPRTLMFAHALGLGLFEKPKLRWLSDDDWRHCGYTLKLDAKTGKYIFSREPLRRFEDLETENLNSAQLVELPPSSQYTESAISQTLATLKEILRDHPTVQPDDVAVIFLEYGNEVYAMADILSATVIEQIGWPINQAYTSKEKTPGRLFISNLNNVKGLEFPFVICVTKSIQDTKRYRNALYMALTRSFIRSYLIARSRGKESAMPAIHKGLMEIMETGKMSIDPPTAEDGTTGATINMDEPAASLHEATQDILKDLGVSAAEGTKLLRLVTSAFADDYDIDLLAEFIATNHRLISRKKQ